jgi:hypothetical protein
VSTYVDEGIASGGGAPSPSSDNLVVGGGSSTLNGADDAKFFLYNTIHSLHSESRPEGPNPQQVEYDVELLISDVTVTCEPLLPSSETDTDVGEYNIPCANNRILFEHQLQHSVQRLLRPARPKHMESRQSIHRLDGYATDGGRCTRGSSRRADASIVWNTVRRSAYLAATPEHPYDQFDLDGNGTGVHPRQ